MADKYVPQYHASRPGETAPPPPRSGPGLDSGPASTSTGGGGGGEGCPPLIRVAGRQQTTSSYQPTTLVCAISGNPTPTLQWLHNSVECTGDRYKLLTNPPLYCLYIEDTQPTDAGDYTLKATNTHGESEAVISVTVLTPVPPEVDSSHKPIPVKDFPALVSKMHRDTSTWLNDFYSVEPEWTLSQHTANLPFNEEKNRYCNVFPYDHSRVVLPLKDNVPGSDFINACHMNDDYISSQGPLPNTFEDFWRMVWGNNIHAIAMVTKLSDEHSFHMKCHRYWPEKEGTLTCGEFTITLKEMKIFSTCEIRLLNVSKQTSEPREICHFQFLSWPEYGVPKNAGDLLDFREKVQEYKSKVPGPLLVHCSAGVGRTGTFLVVDMLLKQLEQGADIDIFNTIRRLRFRRERTVETHEQYLLIHETLAEAVKRK